MMRIGLALMLGLFVLSGCAGSPAAICQSSDPELAKLELYPLCNAYGVHRKVSDAPANVRRELERRNYFTADEWKLIDAKAAEPGMRQLALVASLGGPDTYSETRTQDELVQHWGYSNADVSTGRSLSIVLVNGIVRSVSK